MPRRNDLHRILIVAPAHRDWQACEFDYSAPRLARRSGRWLRGSADQFESGDHHDGSELANRTYVEPLTVEYAKK